MIYEYLNKVIINCGFLLKTKLNLFFGIKIYSLAKRNPYKKKCYTKG